MIDLVMATVVCHLEKEQAAATFEGPVGRTGECLGSARRRVNAGASTAADHIAVLDQAMAQVPAERPADPGAC